MRKFIKRLLLFAAIPLITLILGYVVFDPFKVLYKCDDYSDTFVILNRDYVSCEHYINKKNKYHYNSFIFGSSRTIAFRASSWKKYLNADASILTFDAAAENIYGIHNKLKYLDKTNAKIDNVILILCRDWGFEQGESLNGHIFMKHPSFSENTRINFQFKFFKSYMNTKFLLAYYNFKCTNNYKPWMKFIISNEKATLDSITNEMRIPNIDKTIDADRKKYIVEKGKLFYDRKGETADSINRIKKHQIFVLKDIKRLLEKHKTNYKIISGPLYDQITFSKNDKKILNAIFGNKFYDFTGKNKFTENKENYYESSHFRAHVGNEILETIYKE